MGFIKGLLNVAILPVDVVTDVAKTILEETVMIEEESQSRTKKRIERIEEHFEDGEFL